MNRLRNIWEFIKFEAAEMWFAFEEAIYGIKRDR
jgi:hypothetical protein